MEQKLSEIKNENYIKKSNEQFAYLKISYSNLVRLEKLIERYELKREKSRNLAREKSIAKKQLGSRIEPIVFEIIN